MSIRPDQQQMQVEAQHIIPTKTGMLLFVESLQICKKAVMAFI